MLRFSIGRFHEAKDYIKLVYLTEDLFVKIVDHKILPEVFCIRLQNC